VHDGGGAFDNLKQLRPGALIMVTTSRGQLRYRVSSSKTYLKRTLAAEAQDLFGQRVPGRLVLVTCEDWDGTTFLRNVVVIARQTS
jgi:sortase (surface protein transpeptidase)